MDDDECENTADQITIEVNCDSNEGQHSWPAASSNNVSVVRKPQLTKFKSTRGFREIVEYKPTSESLKKRSKLSAKTKRIPQLTALHTVVSDAPEQYNKLKRPGPFQAASKVGSNNNTENSKLLKRMIGNVGRNENQAFENAGLNGQTKGTGLFSCSHCSTQLSTKLEEELHILAQHRHEIATQTRPLQCLETGCCFACPTLVQFKKHLGSTHDIRITATFFTFQHFDEFSSWKLDMEAASGTRFLFFSSFSEVTGGTTRIYICNNEGMYDHHDVRVGRRRRQRHTRLLPKDGRACPAQLLVRSWGWGAVEVDAILHHYGHCKAGVVRGLELRPITLNHVLKSVKLAAPVSMSSTTEDTSPPTWPPTAGDREGGVRIIEGSLLGHRGMDNLQEELSKWELYDNVTICACKRIHETHNSGLVTTDDFVLGFSTSDQLDVWAAHGSRAVCLDASQVTLLGSGEYECALTVVAVLVLNNRGDAIPVAWLLTTSCSYQILRDFFVCLKMAFETFHNVLAPIAKFLVCDAEGNLFRAWREVFRGPSDLHLVAATQHNDWLKALKKINHLGKRGLVYEEVRACMRNGGCESTVLALMKRLSCDPETQHFAAYMRDHFIPQTEQLKLTTNPPTDNNYNTGLYFDILQGLFSFLFVEEEFTMDYDECVSKVNRYSASVLEETDTSRAGRPGDEGCGRWVQLSEARHQEASGLGSENVSPLSPHSWKVRCHKMAGVWHSVNRCNTANAFKSLCSVTCKQVCWRCAVCIHQYMCSCPDSIVLSTICVHIHLIRIFVLNPQHVPLATHRPPSPLIGPLRLLPPRTNGHSTADLNNKKISKKMAHLLSKDKLKLSIQNTCCSIMSLMKSNNSINTKWTRECLISCDQQLDMIRGILDINTKTTKTSHNNRKPVTPRSCHKKSLEGTKSDSRAAVADELCAVAPEVVSVTAADDVYYNAGCSDLNLQEELSDTTGLLVLREENGRYSLMASEVPSKADDLLVVDPGSKSNVIYLPGHDLHPTTAPLLGQGGPTQHRHGTDTSTDDR